MGYPFDRVGSQRLLTEFLTPNMGVQTVTVRFQNVFKARKPAVNVPRINTDNTEPSETSTRSGIAAHTVVPLEFTGIPLDTESNEAETSNVTPAEKDSAAKKPETPTATAS